jgi:Putative auto-transporter adhesin, head GIN domain
VSRLITASIIALALSAPAFAETKTYSFGNFDKLDISAGYEVIFTQSPQRSVAIESEDFSRITAKESGSTLVIDRPENTRMRGKVHDIVRISAPDLKRVELNAGVKFRVDGLKVDNLDLDVNAGVEADFQRVTARTIRLDANAGVEIELAGSCETLHVDATAGVDIDASNLHCKSANVEAGVGSSVRVHTLESVIADAGLGASIVVAGAPKNVDKHVSLGGSVSVDR